MSNVTLPTISPRGHKILERAARVFTPENRLAQAASESAELSAALTRALAGRSVRKQILEESAHTLMMLAQLGKVIPNFYRDLSRTLASEMRRLDITVTNREREVEEEYQRDHERWKRMMQSSAKHPEPAQQPKKGFGILDAIRRMAACL